MEENRRIQDLLIGIQYKEEQHRNMKRAVFVEPQEGFDIEDIQEY